MAEREGFEPSEPFGSLVFKTYVPREPLRSQGLLRAYSVCFEGVMPQICHKNNIGASRYIKLR